MISINLTNNNYQQLAQKSSASITSSISNTSTSNHSRSCTSPNQHNKLNYHPNSFGST